MVVSAIRTEESYKSLLLIVCLIAVYSSYTHACSDIAMMFNVVCMFNSVTCP